MWCLRYSVAVGQRIWTAEEIGELSPAEQDDLFVHDSAGPGAAVNEGVSGGRGHGSAMSVVAVGLVSHVVKMILMSGSVSASGASSMSTIRWGMANGSRFPAPTSSRTSGAVARAWTRPMS